MEPKEKKMVFDQEAHLQAEKAWRPDEDEPLRQQWAQGAEPRPKWARPDREGQDKPATIECTHPD